MTYIDYNGYQRVQTKDGCRLVHVLVVEQAIGHRLRPTAHVHHVNGNKTDNRPENLVVCESAGYHQLLHARERALAACGDPNARPCGHCGGYSDHRDMYRNGRNAYHRACHAAAAAARRRLLTTS